MIRGEPKELTIFDKANAAAKAAMQSVVDVASRTSTPVIVFRNGRIERLSPTSIADQQVVENQPSNTGKNES